jgi:hypothetical protein
LLCQLACADFTWWERPPHPAPEIDPASALSALTLLAGGIAVLRGRRNHK